MPTSFVSVDVELFSFAVRLASASRLFTTAQLAKHASLSGRSQPTKRAAEWLETHREAFEHIQGIYPYTHLWRLTEAYKRTHRLAYRNVGASQRTGHWLAIGDLWMSLAFHGLHPSKWFTEGKAIGGFDMACVVRDIPYLVEVQCTPLTERQWFHKWKLREEWMKQQQWRPQVILVTIKQMNAHTPGYVRVVSMPNAYKAFGGAMSGHAFA